MTESEFPKGSRLEIGDLGCLHAFPDSFRQQNLTGDILKAEDV